MFFAMFSIHFDLLYISLIWISAFSSLSMSFHTRIFFKVFKNPPSLSFCSNICEQFEILLILNTFFVVNAMLPSNKRHDFHPLCNLRLHGDRGFYSPSFLRQPVFTISPLYPSRLPRDHHSRLIIKVWRHRVFSINIPG